MENLKEIKFGVGRDTYTIYVRIDEVPFFENSISRAVDVRAEEKGKAIAKEYINKAISNGLKFLHDLN